MLLQLADDIFLAGDDASLRTAEQFVSAEADDIHTRGDYIPHMRFIAYALFFKIVQRTTAQIFVENQSLMAILQFRQCFRFHCCGKTGHDEIACMDFHEHSGFFIHCVFIIE